MKTWQRRCIFILTNSICTILRKSYRFKVANPETKARACALHPQHAWIIASWHQNCFAGILGHAGEKVALLVSRSFDGDIVSQIARSLKMNTVRGSSRKGGQEALDRLVTYTQQGHSAAITVDGPKGPPFQPKRGIFQLAAASGAPILPTLAVGKRYWILHKSWDALRIPKPFTRVTILYGEPFLVSAHDLETRLPELTLRLATALQGLQGIANA